MIGFFIKKNFFDGWDHLLSLVVPNLIIFAFIMLGFFVAQFAMNLPTLVSMAVLALVWCGVSIASFAFGPSAAKIADFKSVSLKEWLANFKLRWKDGLFFGLLSGTLMLLALITIPFYLQMEGMVGLFLAAIVFWFLFLCILAFQWILPLQSLMGNSFSKVLKKSFIIFFDNPGFSFFILIYTIFLVVLSIALFMTVPSFCGIILAHTNALRLRLYKYDWLEIQDKEGATNKKKIPWKDLVAEDRENIGPRSLKNFIFPWK